MEQIFTASETLAKIQKALFKGAGLDAASRLEGDERRDFILSQVDRLLTKKKGYPLLALWLSDQFWTADPGRTPMYKTDPLLTPQGLQTLTDREKRRLQLIKEIAGICHDLGLHYEFDLADAFGVKGGFRVSNRRLVEWLTETKYECIAMHTAYIMKKYATGEYADRNYQPAQDALAELFSGEYGELVREPDYTDMPPRIYVKTIINELQRIERHWQRGRKLKLRPDVVMLHDEIYGFVPLRFDKDVLQAAQALYDYMDKELCGRLLVEEYDENLSWSEQPESVKRTASEIMGRFAQKVREVRSEYLGEGWVDDDSLAFAYLLAHAQNCGFGIWREEETL